ncbi:MAG: hypothetical protein ACN4GT_14845 [Gammaproteobacteria bacterium]
MRTRISLAAILFLAISGSANAMSVTWTFQNAFFNDGTSLTGSFDYNPKRIGPFGYSNVNVQTQNGSGLLAQTYNGVRMLSGAIGFTARNGGQSLAILFDDWIGAGGNPDSSIGIGGGEQRKEVVGQKIIRFFGFKIEKDIVEIVGERKLVSGSITNGLATNGTVALVEPATLGIFVFSLAALVMLRRKAII